MNEEKSFNQLYLAARSTCYRALKDLNDYNKDQFKSYTRDLLDRLLERAKYGSSEKSLEKKIKQGERLVVSLEDRCKRVDELFGKMFYKLEHYEKNTDPHNGIVPFEYAQMMEAVKNISYGREVIKNTLNSIKSSKEPIEKILERDAIAKAVDCFSETS